MGYFWGCLKPNSSTKAQKLLEMHASCLFQLQFWQPISIYQVQTCLHAGGHSHCSRKAPGIKPRAGLVIFCISTEQGLGVRGLLRPVLRGCLTYVQWIVPYSLYLLCAPRSSRKISLPWGLGFQTSIPSVLCAPRAPDDLWQVCLPSRIRKTYLGIHLSEQQIKRSNVCAIKWCALRFWK